MDDLTPQQTVEALDRYIIGQSAAKRAAAVAIRTRWRRRQLPEDIRNEVTPANMILIGPTGVGKTEIARRLASLVNAPFVKVEATKYTEVGYHGRDVETMVRDLVEVAIRIVHDEQTEVVREEADRLTEERLLDSLLPSAPSEIESGPPQGEASERRHRSREKLRAQLRAGELEDRVVEVTVQGRQAPVGIMATMGVDQVDPDVQSFLERIMPSPTKARSLPVRAARTVLFDQQCDRLIDRDKVIELAIQRTEESGIIFIDELDKLATPVQSHGPDVSRQGVQRDLLPIIEGCAVGTRYGPVKTDHVLFITAGAFHASKPSDLMPELQGRLPIRVSLEELTRDDFIRILTEPQNALTRQHVALLATEGVLVEFTPDAAPALADLAFKINQTTDNIGARRLMTVMEKLMEEISFNAADLKGQTVRIDAAYVHKRLEGIVQDTDLSRYIL
ncbi:MAG: ATP-dependent protease ATPase subunit HslU [Planctomycetes bacterium]|nr:ATP-dependent protease ATPase subunit HslU [Planctomycetota bacterium]